jgi:hypothetical protein
MKSFEFDFEKFQFKEDALDVEIRNHKVNLSSSSEEISEFKGDNLRTENQESLRIKSKSQASPQEQVEEEKQNQEREEEADIAITRSSEPLG